MVYGSLESSWYYSQGHSDEGGPPTSAIIFFQAAMRCAGLSLFFFPNITNVGRRGQLQGIIDRRSTREVPGPERYHDHRSTRTKEVPEPEKYQDQRKKTQKIGNIVMKLKVRSIFISRWEHRITLLPNVHRSRRVWTRKVKDRNCPEDKPSRRS